MKLMLENSKAIRKISGDLLKLALIDLGPFNELLQEKDENNNNFMHLVECRFSPTLWSIYLQNQDQLELRKIARDQLKHVNNDGLTPVQYLLRKN